MKFIKLKEVMAMTGLGRSSVYKFMNEGRFPGSVKLDKRGVRWVEHEIEEWMMEKIALRDACIVR